MKLRVLVATDDPALAERMALGLSPHVVTTQDTLLGLYAAVTQSEPQVILLDPRMPLLALEAAASFLKAKGALRHRGVVLLTKSGDPNAPDPAALAMRCLASDYVDMAAGVDATAGCIARAARRSAGPFDVVPDSGERKVARSDEGKPMVLVVDDDDAIAHMLKKMLSSKYDVTAVTDGARAIELCREYNHAAIFCDLRMPVVTGADVFRAVRAHDPALAARLVFVTAHQLDPGEMEFFMGLRNHIVHKPFTLREILAAAAQIVAD
jgi:CheY-like chemotaxis protein